MSVNTKKSERRPLRFESIDDIRVELDRLETAHKAEGVRHTGNYSPGQNFNHLANWIEIYETREFGPTPPWFVRVIGKMMKNKIVTKGFPAGLSGPGNKPQPEPEASFEDGVARYRHKLDVLGTLDLAHENPMFGPCTHDFAMQVQLRHAEHHLGFLHPKG
ncbi:MAG: hypothetical protein DHS20C14_04440 [Phycisphaeraceae bacterium]|nr:MAG: hypothetical protein DHS20C14_04440 [Phycisphaeraceae bacterium]